MIGYVNLMQRGVQHIPGVIRALLVLAEHSVICKPPVSTEFLSLANDESYVCSVLPRSLGVVVNMYNYTMHAAQCSKLYCIIN